MRDDEPFEAKDIYDAMHAYYGLFWATLLVCGPMFAMHCLRATTADLVHLCRHG